MFLHSRSTNNSITKIKKNWLEDITAAKCRVVLLNIPMRRNTELEIAQNRDNAFRLYLSYWIVPVIKIK
jgi:hypothetical protein